jgi:hemerythrin
MAIRARLQVAHLDYWLLDAEHGHMVRLIENVENTITLGKDKSAIRSEFDRLVTWTAKHFEHENDCMLRTKFNKAKEHIEHHRQLEELLMGFVTVSANTSDQKVCAAEAIQFLEEWLLHHIETDDTKLAEFLASKATP